MTTRGDLFESLCDAGWNADHMTRSTHQAFIWWVGTMAPLDVVDLAVGIGAQLEELLAEDRPVTAVDRGD